jgi:hypothetical protein
VQFWESLTRNATAELAATPDWVAAVYANAAHHFVLLGRDTDDALPGMKYTIRSLIDAASNIEFDDGKPSRAYRKRALLPMVDLKIGRPLNALKGCQGVRREAKFDSGLSPYVELRLLTIEGDCFEMLAAKDPPYLLAAQTKYEAVLVLATEIKAKSKIARITSRLDDLSDKKNRYAI